MEVELKEDRVASFVTIVIDNWKNVYTFFHTLQLSLFLGNFWWDNAEHYGPKWGLYRHKSNVFPASDYQYFQNVQIWKA